MTDVVNLNKLHRRDVVLNMAASAATLALTGCVGAQPSPMVARGPQLWRIARGEGDVVLFGFGDARDQGWLSPALRSAFADAGELWLETAGQDAQPSPSVNGRRRLTSFPCKSAPEVDQLPIRKTLRESRT